MHLGVVKRVPLDIGGDSNCLAKAWEKLCKQRTDVCFFAGKQIKKNKIKKALQMIYFFMMVI
jgi:hypothetical protein